MSEQKLRPAKRLKNWHRKYGGGMPLRAYARATVHAAAVQGDVSKFPAARVANAWLTSKGL